MCEDAQSNSGISSTQNNSLPKGCKASKPHKLLVVHELSLPRCPNYCATHFLVCFSSGKSLCFLAKVVLLCTGTFIYDVLCRMPQVIYTLLN